MWQCKRRMCRICCVKRRFSAQMNCVGVDACAEAQINITRHVPGFSLNCVGLSSGHIWKQFMYENKSIRCMDTSNHAHEDEDQNIDEDTQNSLCRNCCFVSSVFGGVIIY
eukprot:922145_1